MHQLSSHRAINATANGTDHASFLATDFPNATDFFPDEGFLLSRSMSTTIVYRARKTHHCPIRLAFHDFKDKVGDDLLSARRMGDFRVELDSVDGLCVMGYRCQRSGLCLADDMEVGRDGGKLVSVGHPDLMI